MKRTERAGLAGMERARLKQIRRFFKVVERAIDRQIRKYHRDHPAELVGSLDVVVNGRKG